METTCGRESVPAFDELALRQCRRLLKEQGRTVRDITDSDSRLLVDGLGKVEVRTGHRATTDLVIEVAGRSRKRGRQSNSVVALDFALWTDADWLAYCFLLDGVILLVSLPELQQWLLQDGCAGGLQVLRGRATHASARDRTSVVAIPVRQLQYGKLRMWLTLLPDSYVNEAVRYYASCA